MMERLHKGDAIFDTDNGICCRCRAPATLISLSFEGAFCTTDCLDLMWDEYFEACRIIQEGTIDA